MSDPERPVERPDRVAEAGPVALSNLLDEIRADVRWREEIAALRARSTEAEAASGTPGPGPTLDGILDALDEAIANADRVVPIEPGRPVVGDAWARIRRQIHGEIRLYQDRQTAVNRQVATALRRIDARLAALRDALEARLGATDALAAEIEPIGALRVAVEEIEARLVEVERWRASS